MNNKLVEIEVAGYENVTATCPYCKNNSIYNRASDLETFECIGNHKVMCLRENCGKGFSISGDRTNSAHEMFLSDCEPLLEQKKYMGVILNITQAYEVFFRQYLLVEYAWRPFWSNGNHDTDELNSLYGALNKKIKLHSFSAMRNLFLTQVLRKDKPENLSGAKKLIKSFPNKPRTLDNTEVQKYTDHKIRKLLLAIKNTKVSTLRNNVAHKYANRPTRKVAEDMLDEAKNTLLSLASRLDVCDEINFYNKDHQ